MQSGGSDYTAVGHIWTVRSRSDGLDVLTAYSQTSLNSNPLIPPFGFIRRLLSQVYVCSLCIHYLGYDVHNCSLVTI